MKRSIAAAVAAVALASASQAFAADFILSDQAPGGPSDPNFHVTFQSPTFVSADLGNNPGATTFLDRYIFATTFLGVGSGFAGANASALLTFDNPGLTIKGYSFATAAGAGFNIFNDLVNAFSTTNAGVYGAALTDVQNYLATNPLAVSSYVGDPFTPPGGGDGRARAGVVLDPNNFYVIGLSGTGQQAGSLYSGNISVTSVPEPATWAMMLAGFGLIGFSMRRRSQVQPKVRFAF